MKITNLFALLLMVTIFASCDNDDDSMTSSDDLVGTWAVTKIDYEGDTETVNQGAGITSTFVGEGYDMDLVIEFSQNPNEFKTSGDYSIKLTTTTQGQSYETDVTNNGFINEGEWTKNGNEITVTSTANQEEQTATILELTATTLKIAWEFTETIQLPQSGGTSTINTMGEYTFTKQ